MADRLFVEKKINDDLISYIDAEDFFGLSNKNAERIELFMFAMALGVKEGKRTPLVKKKDLILEKYINNFDGADAMITSVLINELRKTNEDEKISDKDLAFVVAQEYANTGFHILQDIIDDKTMDEETFLWETIADLDEKYDEIVGDDNE